MLSGRFDAAIMFNPADQRPRYTHIIHRERMSLAVHATTLSPVVRWLAQRQLKGEALIATPVDSIPMLREAIVQYCRVRRFRTDDQAGGRTPADHRSLVTPKISASLVPESHGKLGIANLVQCRLEAAPAIEQCARMAAGQSQSGAAPVPGSKRACLNRSSRASLNQSR